jgi:transketolase
MTMHKSVTRQSADGAGGGESALDTLCINTIRTLSIDAVQKANSGHPGLPMGAATMAYTLWTRHLRHNPRNPTWPGRDRFVLSAGHGSMLLYSLLYLTGYDLSLDDIKRFRQWESKTPGHPEFGLTPGVEATTGPLGQGFAMGVGMGIAAHHLAARFNRPGHEIVDHYIYVLCSDGDLMEGVSSEAASLAGTFKLGRLIYLYDDNEISIDGSTDLTFKEDVGKRFEAYGWHVQHIDGEDMAAVDDALRKAQAETERPSLIDARTIIGYGSPNKAGTAEVHGEPLGEDEVRLTKEALHWPVSPDFLVPKEALEEFRRAVLRGEEWEDAWEQRMEDYARAFPEDGAQLRSMLAGKLPDGWEKLLPSFSAGDGPMATRTASGKVIEALEPSVELFFGGSGDLSGSTKTYFSGAPAFSASDYGGRNIHFGVREFGMAGAANGIARHGGYIPFIGTYLVFSDYMRPAVRLAAMQQAHVIFVFTHDSIGLGEDGPTHQPIEQLASLRAMPGLQLLRPADANETVAAWKLALEHPGPTALALTRQNIPVLGTAEEARAGVPRRAYVFADADGGRPDVIPIGTGSEVAVRSGRELTGTAPRTRGEYARLGPLRTAATAVPGLRPAAGRAGAGGGGSRRLAGVAAVGRARGGYGDGGSLRRLRPEQGRLREAGIHARKRGRPGKGGARTGQREGSLIRALRHRSRPRRVRAQGSGHRKAPVAGA